MATTPLHALAEELRRLADELVGHADAVVLNQFTVGNPNEGQSPTPPADVAGADPNNLGGAGEPLATAAPDTPVGDTAAPSVEEPPPAETPEEAPPA